MKLENQAVSLELAKELKELGVKQESLFYWGRNKNRDRYNKGKYEEFGIWYVQLGNNFPGDITEYVSAFTVAELGEMLPAGVFTDKGAVHDKKWVACFSRYSEFNRIKDGESVDCLTIEDTEADARAKMLIYLIKNKLITV